MLSKQDGFVPIDMTVRISLKLVKDIVGMMFVVC